jgi:alanine dehydrogenase
VTHDRVTELGDVLAGEAAGRPEAAGDQLVTLFDSTGLAIQDLAVARAAYDAWRDGVVQAQEITL